MSKMPKDIFEFEEALLEQVDDYALRNEVLGLEDIRTVRVLYPTTIYEVKGDETSGVAGLLYPDGKFLAARSPRSVAAYWEFDETLAYEPHYYESEARWGAKANSWTADEVVWDGSVAGSINQNGRSGDETDAVREIVKRREWDAALTDEWQTTGELWKGIESGRSMKEMAPRNGRIHMGISNWDDREYGQAA